MAVDILAAPEARVAEATRAAPAGLAVEATRAAREVQAVEANHAAPEEEAASSVEDDGVSGAADACATSA